MRHEVEDFCDQRLGSFEIVLDKLMRTVHAGRERLNIGVRRGRGRADPRTTAARRSSTKIARDRAAVRRQRGRAAPPAGHAEGGPPGRPGRPGQGGRHRRARRGPDRSRPRAGEPERRDRRGRARSPRPGRGPAGGAWSPWAARSTPACGSCTGPGRATTTRSPSPGDQLDLEPMVREAVLLELPLAPLCRPDCAGLCPECGANRNEVDVRPHDRGRRRALGGAGRACSSRRASTIPTTSRYPAPALSPE